MIPAACPTEESSRALDRLHSPGAVWLALPGVLVFRDPRLFEYAGSVVLFLGTLFGTFLLTRRYLGSRCALLAVALYAFSEPGLLAASSLWQHYTLHTFYVWMVYWATRWVDDDNPYFLGLSVLTWALGMYAFPEIAPAIFAIPRRVAVVAIFRSHRTARRCSRCGSARLVSIPQVRDEPEFRRRAFASVARRTLDGRLQAVVVRSRRRASRVAGRRRIGEQGN